MGALPTKQFSLPRELCLKKTPSIGIITYTRSGVQNWFVLTEKFQVLKICLRKIPKFASGNFFNVAILVRFCPRVLLDDSAVLNFAPEFSQTASPSEFCLRQVRYLAPPAPKSFNFTFSSLRLENLPPAWKFASGEVLSISPQFCTPGLGPMESNRGGGSLGGHDWENDKQKPNAYGFTHIKSWLPYDPPTPRRF